MDPVLSIKNLLDVNNKTQKEIETLDKAIYIEKMISNIDKNIADLQKLKNNMIVEIECLFKMT